MDMVNGVRVDYSGQAEDPVQPSSGSTTMTMTSASLALVVRLSLLFEAQEKRWDKVLASSDLPWTYCSSVMKAVRNVDLQSLKC